MGCGYLYSRISWGGGHPAGGVVFGEPGGIVFGEPGGVSPRSLRLHRSSDRPKARGVVPAVSVLSVELLPHLGRGPAASGVAASGSSSGR